MSASASVAFIAATASFVLAFFVWIRERTSIPAGALALGLVLFGADSLLAGLSLTAVSPEHVVAMQRLRFVPIAAMPGVWLLFSLTYSRGGYRDYVRPWKLGLAIIGAVPVATAVLSLLTRSRWLLHTVSDANSGAWLIAVGPGGSLIYSVFIIGAVLVLMNLERTLRAATGTMRWRIKFMVAGTGILFCFRMYTATQALLYSSLDLSWPILDAGVLTVCLLLMLRALPRARLLNVDIYPSQTVLYKSLTATVAGLYLLAVGLLAKLAVRFGVTRGFALNAFVLLLAVVGLTVLLLSDRVRQGTRRIVSRHFGRPQYDYREIWKAFSTCTTSVTDTQVLCQSLVNMISDTFEVLGVTIWVWDGVGEGLVLGASTSLSHDESRRLLDEHARYRELAECIPQLPDVLDLDRSDRPEHRWLRDLVQMEFAAKGGHRFCVPIRTGDDTLGLLMLGDRVRGLPFTDEELELLTTIGEQTAAALLNIRLSMQLFSAKQLEAFQAMSAFFVHDLKNTSAALSLTLQNLPRHFSRPEFREDALATISESVKQINDLIARLTVLRKDLELKRVTADMNAIVKSSVEALEPSARARVSLSLGDAAPALIDPKQMGKVLTNLLLNACDATGDDGRVWIETGAERQRVFVSVRDNGVGMTPEFMEKYLFRPFKSTKPNGMGIGLFHSRTIVEAHGGRLEATSGRDEGTTFRIVLPTGKQLSPA